MAYFFTKNFWLDLLFPVRCLGCSQESRRNKDCKSGQGLLCLNCRQLLKFTSCDYNLNIANVDQILIAGDYDDPLLSSLIKKLKFNSLVALGEVLSDFIILFWQGRAWQSFEFGKEGKNNLLPKHEESNLAQKQEKNILVIPIPISKKRRRARGFNQAEIIAQNFATAFTYQIEYHLIKNRHTKAQANLSAQQRSLNLKQAFSWTGRSLKNKTIILLDDVITTGATIEEAAQVLKVAGAKKIIALAVAKG